ncbi:hypothetical protein PMIN06_006324 [Paraphaeosphaeria minitans]
MHSFLTLALTLLLLPLTTTQDTPPRECNDASTAVCCPSLASNASGPCGANAEPVRNVTECTQEKYPQGWACCIDKEPKQGNLTGWSCLSAFPLVEGFFTGADGIPLNGTEVSPFGSGKGMGGRILFR